MKKALTILILIFVSTIYVKAERINAVDIQPSTYIIGTYMYTRSIHDDYDGKLTTQRIMLASKSINSTNESDMIVYYKTSDGNWINALTGSSIIVPDSFLIQVFDLDIELVALENPNDLTNYRITPDKIYPSTYVIGNHMFTRDVNLNDHYNGNLTTQRIMIGARTINGTVDSEMIFYYKSSSGNWVNALTGESIVPPTFFEIQFINLRNQIENPYTPTLATGSTINTKFKKLAGNSSATYTSVDENIVSVKEVYSVPDGMLLTDDNIISDPNSDIRIYAWYDDGTINYYIMKFYDKETELYLNNISGYLFYKMSNLKTVDLTHVNASDTTIMMSMFEGCSSLESVNLENLKPTKVTNMYGMFNGCNSLTTVNFNNFDTSRVLDISYLFAGCSSIATLDLSPLDLSSVINSVGVFSGMTSLMELKTPKVNSNNEITLPRSMHDSLGTEYTFLNATTPTETILSSETRTIKGADFNVKLKVLAGNPDATKDSKDENILEVRRASTLKEGLTDANVISSSSSKIPLYAWYEDGIIYYYSDYAKVFLDSEITYMFANMSNLRSIDLSIFDTSKVMYMSYLFANDVNLTNIDMGGFDLSKIKQATSVFSGMTSLSSLITPSINSNVEIILSKTLYDDMGNAYTKLTATTPTATEIGTRTKLVTGQVFNGKIKKLAGHGSADYSLIDESVKAIIRSSSLPSMEMTDENIVSTDDSRYQIYIWYDNGNIYYYTDAAKIYLNKIISYMFYQLKALESVDLSAFYTNDSTNMAYMFYGCTKLESLDLSRFDTSNVAYTSYMFYGCKALTDLNLGSFNLLKILDASMMLTSMDNLLTLTTPRVNAPIMIPLPATMYDSDNNSYTYLEAPTPNQIVLRKLMN